ncbi:hypothetical protein [Shinella sp.]|uniref:hypothetical protein n=1 Tax=Shinella sp. TaxID=1870904 RepID=UPI003F6F4202
MSEDWTSRLSSSWWTMPAETVEVEPGVPVASPLGSLVSRRSIYTRNGIAWLSVRAWSSRARKEDVAALRSAKRSVDQVVIDGAAAEIADFAGMLIGRPVDWMVSTVAVGHSRRPDSFAVRMAEAVAGRLDVPFSKLFADRFVDGVSHPKEFSKLPQLNMLVQPTQPVILVDDVATSGWHLEEALTRLRQSGVPAMAIAWISGTVK